MNRTQRRAFLGITKKQSSVKISKASIDNGGIKRKGKYEKQPGNNYFS